MKQSFWWLGVGITAFIVGLGAQRIALPGGWLIGPLLVTLIIALSQPAHPKVASVAVRAAQGVIGMLIAGIFRPSILPLLAANWFVVLLIVSITLGFSLIAGMLLGRFTSLDKETAALGTLPGGASGMIAVSVSLGADTRLVALMQYVRLVMVVFFASLLARLVLHSAAGAAGAAPVHNVLMAGAVGPHPWLTYLLTALLAIFGSWVGVRLRIPAGTLLGPLLFGITANLMLHLRPAWPPGLPEAAYMVIGVYVGLLFDRASIRQAGRLVPVVVLTTLALMSVCAAMGMGLALMTHTRLLTGYLATTPGGMDTITVVALGSGADVSLILAMQLARLLSTMLTAPLLTRRLIQQKARRED